MSYFNEEQQEYMKALADMPPSTKCWCGWYRLGECRTCPPGKTLADRQAASCPICGNYPSTDGGQIFHRIGCREGKQR